MLARRPNLPAIAPKLLARWLLASPWILLWILCGSVILGSLWAAPAMAETWTNLEGTSSIEAKMIGLWDDQLVLELSDGRRVTIKLEKLRFESRIQAGNLAKKMAAERTVRIKELKQGNASAATAGPDDSPPPPRPPAYVPPTKDAPIGQFIEQVNGALTAGHLRVLYDFRPPSYRQDIAKIIQLAAAKTSPQTFQALIQTPHQLGTLIVTHQNWLVSSPRFKNIPASERDQAKSNLLGLAHVMRQGLSPAAIDLPQLQAGKFEDWLADWDAIVAPYVAQMIDQAELDLSAFTKVQEEGAGTATIATGPPDAPVVVEMVQVDGYWVPKTTAESWADDVAQATAQLEKLPTGQFMAAQAVAAAMVAPALESLATVDSAPAFHAAFDALLSQAEAAAQLQQVFDSILSPIQTIMAAATNEQL
jgi:hypothetical protein